MLNFFSFLPLPMMYVLTFCSTDLALPPRLPGIQHNLFFIELAKTWDEAHPRLMAGGVKNQNAGILKKHILLFALLTNKLSILQKGSMLHQLTDQN